ncbi:hypothetical protein [Nonomuraea fuscirosea]|uniref:hypothetical protein n=1 Tax=Nonomuraea fuscirosea TaxID=1291556 RepID=UPI00342C7C98
MSLRPSSRLAGCLPSRRDRRCRPPTTLATRQQLADGTGHTGDAAAASDQAAALLPIRAGVEIT